MCILQVSYWVASEICCVEDARLRVILLEKFIEVAKVRDCICNSIIHTYNFSSLI